MIWPFKRKSPQIETRAFGTVTADFINTRRQGLVSDQGVPLSATIGTALHFWSSGLSMVETAPEPIDPNVLSTIARDLLFRGESCWHIRLTRGQLDLQSVPYWDQVSEGQYHLHIPRVNKTETIKAVEDEVLHFTINPDPAQPWRGRSPWRMMGLSPALMAEIEQAVSTATNYAGKGVLPFPANIAPEERQKATSGLRSGSLAVIASKSDLAHHTGGERSEWRKVDLTPDLQRADLNPFTDSLHHRLLNAAGIPPALTTGSGNAGAMREGYRLFALQTVLPMAKMMLPELRAKLGVTGVSIDQMMSADVAGRARAVGVLTGAGVELDKAMKLVGWE